MGKEMENNSRKILAYKIFAEGYVICVVHLFCSFTLSLNPSFMSSFKLKSLLILAITFGGFSCSPEKKAQKSFKYAKYEKVISYYKNVLTKQPNNPKANYFVAESYRLSNRIKEAEPYYAKAKGRGLHKDSATLYYSKSLEANGKYDEAKKKLQDLISST